MSENIKRDRIICYSSIGLALLCYITERFVEYSIDISTTDILIMTVVFTAAFAVIVTLIFRIDNLYHKILASLFGFKLVPPDIYALDIQVSYDAMVFYHTIQNLAVIIFVVLIIKNYIDQETKNDIHLIPILSIMAVMPLFSKIGDEVGQYITIQLGGSLVYMFFTQYFFYILSFAIILLLAYRSNYYTFRLVAHYEYLALGINVLRRFGLVAIKLVNHEHVSKNLLCWIAIYILIMGTVYILHKQKRAIHTQ